MNEHDSETMAGLLINMGLVRVDDCDDADIEIMNTCSVRENADKHFFGTLGQLKKRKESEPEFLVCVSGCMMQQQSIIDTLKAKYPWVDLVIGTHNIHMLPSLLEKVSNEKTKLVDVWPDTDSIVEGMPSERLFKHKALVNITFGCNNFCTYCIVPYTRGREKSRVPDAIISEIESLVDDGVKEVMLLGQNVNSYKGMTDDGSYMDFATLIKRINDIEGLERIRFMTSHPKDLSDSLINAFKECEKLCKNIHLPVQAGSNEILRRMNRHYSREQYIELVNKIRAAVPEITISTDIIVGFPGETEEDFEETLSLVREIEYDSAFTFLYSIRTGTPAASYPDQIPEEIKHKRFDRLVEAVNEISERKNKAYLGKTELVLVEGKSKTDDKTLTGRTDGFKLVNFPGDESLIGKKVKVEITDAKTFSLMGQIIE